MKRKTKAWALYERDFDKIAWSAVEGGMMIFKTRKEAKKMRGMLAEFPTASDAEKSIAVIKITISGKFPE